MTFAHWDIAADAADLHEHHHPQEEMWNVVDGEVVLVLKAKDTELRALDTSVCSPSGRRMDLGRVEHDA